MMTILFLLALVAIVTNGFWGAALGMAGGLYGGYQEKKAANKVKDAKKLAIQKQINMWKQAYQRSMREFSAARQGILDREQQSYGGLTAGLASGGLLNTTVAPNMARGIKSDTNQSLMNLASQKASTEYGKWMDLGQIKSQWGDIYGGGSGGMGGAAAGWGQFGAELGSMFGGMDFSSLFGGGGGGLSASQMNNMNAAFQNLPY